MQRLSALLLSLVVAGSASAQSQPSTSSGQQPAAAADSEKKEGASGAEGEAKEEPKEEEGTQNARLAPGGVVAGGSGFPLHIQATLDNSVGNGIFAPGYQAQPSWSSSLNLRPSASLPKFADWAPRMLLSGSITFGVNNWLPSFSNSDTFDRQITLSDASLTLIMPGLYREEFTGIGFSLIAQATAPLSLGSRQNNNITNLVLGGQFMWLAPETPVGQLFVQYTPSVRGSLYSQVGPTIACGTPTSLPPASNGSQPNVGFEDIPLAFGRTEQLLPNGDCILAGRQSMASVSNRVTTGWSLDAHNLSVGLSWAHTFLRPLKNDPNLVSSFASGQNFNESNSGFVAYTYTVPVDFNMFLSGGIFSSQPAYNRQGGLRFPFYDFVTPANNFSGAFFDVTVGI